MSLFTRQTSVLCASVSTGKIHTCRLGRRWVCFLLSFVSGLLQPHPGHSSQMTSVAAAPRGLQKLYHRQWTVYQCLPDTKKAEVQGQGKPQGSTITPDQMKKQVQSSQSKSKVSSSIHKEEKEKKTKTIITHRNRNHTQALVNVAQNISSLLSIHHLWFSFPLFCCQWLGKTLMIIWTIFTGHQLDLWNESKYSLGVMLVQIWSRHGSYLVMIGGEKSCCVNYRWVKGSERERNRSWREWSAWNRSTAGKNKMPLTKKIGLCVCHGEEKKAKSGE